MSDIRYYTADQVREALPMANAIDAMRFAFGELSAGRVQLPQRAVVPCENGAVTLVMSGRCDVRFGLGAKIVSVFPANREKGKPTIHAVVVLLDEETGEPVALMDGESLTAIRTGAASGLATDLLARPEASTVAIVGAGAQARTQLEAVCAVRDVRRVAVCARSTASAQRMVADVRGADWLANANVEVADSVSAAVDGVDIICTATNSTVPILRGVDVQTGAHVNAVGSFAPVMQELDLDLVRSAFVVVDHRPTALAEAGEIIRALDAGVKSEGDLVEIGELVNERVEVPSDGAQTTIFKSVGVAVQDLVAGAWIVARGRTG